ncbi:DNA polymerase theta (polymerase domain only) [Trypanosoma grayi]|uniref:DNA polymerase theta (polymerase domain only) n=1 Tax=Trypanosoma grayi TaxID=71804 RepID=UPI0004F418DB|nr:DNA polymerase theta (polymerase domain only) [Trypanosoma grayi]KEG10521.1 DNA polymerase theta (polymerase domain only) [Trypanosoma grayi]
MSHAVRFTRPRSRANSVLFWAAALEESQRPHRVAPPLRATSGRADTTPAEEQQQQTEQQEGERDEEKEKEEATQPQEKAGTVIQPEQVVLKHESQSQQELVIERFPVAAADRLGDLEERSPKRPRTEESDAAQQQEQPQEQEHQSGDAATTTTTGLVAPGPAAHRFEDVLPVSDALLQGLLGPVAIDVELSGTIPLLRDPHGFAAALAAMEKASCDVLRNFQASVQLFFIVRGESYYTLDAAKCPPVVFLARLLAAPAVTKILLQAPCVYRLLFLLLGTDRVVVHNVIDVAVWAAVVSRVGGPRPWLKACTKAQELMQLLPESEREVIAVRLQNATQAARYDSTAWRDGNEDESVESSISPTLLSSSMSTVAAVPLTQLVERLESLATLHAYYDAYLSSVDSSGATGKVSTPLSAVCRLETRVTFLCEVMSYHGMFIEKRLHDDMLHDLDTQVAALIEEGNKVLRAVVPRDGDNDVDMETATARDLVVLLLKQQQGSLPRGEGRWEQQLQDLSARLAEKGDSGGNVAHIWLALQERLAFRRSLREIFSNGARIHARLFAVPELTTGSGNDTDDCRSADSEAAKHRLFFSVHPSWVVHHASTARLYCSKPNLQTLPKKPSLCRYALPSSTATTILSNPEWTLRHLYGAPPECSLLSFDFNQIELRVLAHLSGDALLVEQLRGGVDVLAEMARRIIGLHRPEDVQPYMRQAVKVVVYGLLYGMGPELMDQRLRQLYAESLVDTSTAATERPPLSALQFLHAFNRCYPGVRGFLKNTRLRAFHERSCVTLSGVWSLSGELDDNRRKQSSVSLAIQGGAAVILHHAMLEVHERRHEFVPYFPAAPVALVMSVHDELVYVVPDSAVGILAPKIKQVLERQATALSLSVPLPVSVKGGKTLGTLEPLPV